MAETKTPEAKKEEPKRFEYVERDLGEIIGFYISHNLPNPETWQIPAIDTLTKCVMFRREIKEVKEVS